MNKIILYASKFCPRCTVLKQKLDAKNIDYEIVTDIEEAIANDISSVPVLVVDGKKMDFVEANNWVNSLGE